MTTIFSVIDASIQQAQRDASRPPPSKDFGHELAKQESQAKLPAQGNTKATADNEFEQLPKFEPMEVMAASTVSETLPQADVQAALQQQMEAIEHVMVAPTGVTQALLGARVFGWHAMAQAYLSELTAADGSAEQSDASKAEQAFTNIQAESIQESQVNAEVATPAVAKEAASVTSQPETPTKLQQPVVLDDTTPASAVERPTTNASAVGYWAERSLRFTRQRDGSSVAWLRDFRLSGEEASHLIRMVLDDAKAKGVDLSRIMLNGREAWTSPSTS